MYFILSVIHTARGDKVLPMSELVMYIVLIQHEIHTINCTLHILRILYLMYIV